MNLPTNMPPQPPTNMPPPPPTNMPPKLSLVPPPTLSLQNPSKSQFQIKVKEIFDNFAQTIRPLTYVPPCISDLNSGAFGEVCLLVSNDKQYAVKKINLKKYEEYAVYDENNAIQIIKDIINKEIINYAAISYKCKEYFCNLDGYKYDDAEFKLYIVMNCILHTPYS